MERHPDRHGDVVAATHTVDGVPIDFVRRGSYQCDEGHGPCNQCADCVDVEPESLWRERHELLADFDDLRDSPNNASRGEDMRRIELDVAIGTRDAIADLVDELRILNTTVRALVDEALLRKTLES